jgi:hypothetical protein
MANESADAPRKLTTRLEEIRGWFQNVAAAEDDHTDRLFFQTKADAISEALAALRSAAGEEAVIDHILGHWFTQGGKAQFGELDLPSKNADGVVSAILSAVKESQASTMREFVGWLSADIDELHAVEVPLLADSLARFLALKERQRLGTDF